MNNQRVFFLVLILLAFGAISLGFFWQEISTARSTFLAGTHPVTDSDTSSVPTLPPLRTSDPVRGNTSDKAVTIVEFADFSCLYCRLTEEEIIKTLNQSPIPVRLVWRDFPVVTEHPDGLLAAVAGRCATAQGKFWEMHDALFQLNQFDLTSLKNIATQLKLNPVTFGACLTSETPIAQIQNDITLARQHNINGAPTLFVGKQALSGSIKAEQLTAAIRQASSSP